jgi:PTH1 family peptidyl-tRNA hydrolase
VPEPWLVVGLGNPGDRYAKTRHNAGWLVVDLLCERLSVRRRKARFSPVEFAEAKADGTSLLLVTAGQYMNVSGPPVASFAKKRGVPVDRVVVVHDDIDLAFGALRVKKGGSTAGHHGLESFVEAFRSADFYRVRIGIGRPPGRQDVIDFVLQPFAPRDREDAQVLVEEAADAVLSLVTEGLQAAQDRFNRGGLTQRPR